MNFKRQRVATVIITTKLELVDDERNINNGTSTIIDDEQLKLAVKLPKEDTLQFWLLENGKKMK
jgi:hypothetical protein